MRASAFIWGIVLATLALAGCPSETFESDLEQLQSTEPGLTTDALGGFDNSGPVLAGTAICPAIECTGTCPEGWEASDVAAQCFTQSVDGDATLEDACLWLEGAGDTTWQFDPTPCDANDDGYAPEADQVSFRVVDPSGLASRMDQWAEEAALGGLSPAPGTAFPDDLLVPAGDLEVTDDGTPGSIGLRLSEGAKATVALVVDEAAWDAVELVAVASDAPASVEVVAAFYPGEDLEPDAGYTTPWGARAVVRDADGQTIYGAPVDWRISEGRPRSIRAPGPLTGSRTVCRARTTPTSPTPAIRPASASVTAARA